MHKKHSGIVLAGLLVLLLAVGAGLLATADWNGTAGPAKSKQAAAPPLVDQTPLQTARTLATLAVTPEEQQFSQQALRLADHEVDLAFSSAIRDAADHPAPQTPEVRELAARAKKLDAQVKSEQAEIAQIKKSLASAKPQQDDALQQQLALAQAQEGLDEDELADAREDLARAGGDLQGKIKRMLEEHEASQHEGDSVRLDPIVAKANNNSQTLLAQVRRWNANRYKEAHLANAEVEASNAAAQLSREHNSLEQHVSDEKNGPQPQPTAANNATTSHSAALAKFLHLSDDQKTLAEYDKRIQDQQDLKKVYAEWGGMVKSAQRASLHSVLESLFLILLILFFVHLADRAIDHFFAGLGPQRKRLLNLRVVVRFAAQAVGVLLILLVVFGTPNQTPTVLGLAGAGLTVALKDFIVAFFGWFVLMGKNGIRVGDWVEINGVGGEVVEIGLLRTVLLETGSWTDAGHPTGRKVTFINSFAIEGHYFNFSTSGQWLWDELPVLIPAGENPYPLIEQIQKLVAEETESYRREAEQEWQRVTQGYGVQSFSAAPAVTVRPTTQGIEILVRYITRAHERFALRSRLYHAAVQMLHGKKIEPLAVGSAAEAQ
jgi:small-conductance mechanosensitive channel